MKYQLFPPLSPEEFAALEASIVEHGVLVPVEYDEAGEILDGHHRVEICQKLGLADWPRFVRKGLSEVDKRSLARELNFARRHLSTAQKQSLIADQLRDTPSISSRAIAARLGVHHTTVQTVRKQLEDGGEISHHDEVEGRDGIKQPAKKTIKTAFMPEKENRRELMAVAKLIRADQQKLRHQVRLAHMGRVAENGRATAPGRLDRAYAVYYADPPWKFGVRSEVTGREKSAENHYPTMTTDEIVALLVDLIGGEHPAVFFCWATNPMLLDALRVLQACGFTYVHHWMWDKEVAGTGYWGRDQHELLLIGRRGDVAAPLPGTQPATVHRERKGPHSAKPDHFAEQIEKLYPGVPRIELFCRSPRPGWDVWGFEAGGERSETSNAPVAFSTAPKAGSLPEAAGTRQEAAPLPNEGHVNSPGRTSSPAPVDTAGGAAAPPATRPSVTQDELDEWRLLGLVDGGATVAGAAVDEMIERGLIWRGNLAGKSSKLSLTAGGSERLAELEPRVKAASDGDAVKVATHPSRAKKARDTSPRPDAGAADGRIPSDLRPAPGKRTEITIGGMRENATASLSFGGGSEGTFTVSYRIEFPGHCSLNEAFGEPVEGFSEAVERGLRLMTQMLRVIGNKAGATEKHEAAAKGGIAWVAKTAKAWGVPL